MITDKQQSINSRYLYLCTWFHEYQVWITCTNVHMHKYNEQLHRDLYTLTYIHALYNLLVLNCIHLHYQLMLHNLILQSLVTCHRSLFRLNGHFFVQPTVILVRRLSQIISARCTLGRCCWRPSPSCSASWWRAATGNGVCGMCRGTCFQGRSSRVGLQEWRRRGAGWVADAGTC